MPIQKYDTADAIPAELKDAAIETKDGTFVVLAEPDTAGLKSALDKERDAAKREAKARRDLEARLAALEEEKQASAAGLTADKLAEIRKQAEAKFAADLAERDTLRQEVRSLKLDSRVKSLLADADVVNVDAAWKLLADQFDLTDDGAPIAKADPTTDLKAYIAGKVKADYPFLFKGTQADGGEARGGRTGAAGAGDNVFAWTPEQRAAYVQQHGLGAYQDKLDQATLARATKAA